MDNVWIQGSFGFRCTHAELALIEEAFEASERLVCKSIDAPDPSPEFAVIFPAIADGDPWSGFRSIFSDPDYPIFGADFAARGPIAEDPALSIAWIYSATDFQAEPIADLIRRACQQTLAKAPIGFEWCKTCDRPVAGEFSGGWCAIFRDRIELETTGEALARALEGAIL